MGRPSSIDRQPIEIRDKIKVLRTNGRTIDEILGKLEELEVDVSRSALGRHIQGLDKVIELTRESRKAAEMICERLGANPDNRVARANIEIMHAQVMRLLTAERTGENIVFGPEDVFFLSKAIQSLASAAKVDQEATIKLRDQIRAEEREKAAKEAKEAVGAALDGVARKAAIDPETLATIRRDVYGIIDRPES